MVAGQTDTVQISRQAQAALAEELTPEEQAEVAELKATDRKVRSHEQAHLAAAGPYARGGISYEYETGPDDNEYAVGGEVNIDTSPVSGDPEATIRKAQVIRAAAQAPADPSGQDRRVAAAATQMEANARQEIREQQVEAQSARREASEAGADGQTTSTAETSSTDQPETLGDSPDESETTTASADSSSSPTVSSPAESSPSTLPDGSTIAPPPTVAVPTVANTATRTSNTYTVNASPTNATQPAVVGTLLDLVG